MSTLAKKRKKTENAKKQPTENQRMLNINLSAKGGPLFTISLPAGKLAPLSPRQLPHGLYPFVGSCVLFAATGQDLQKQQIFALTDLGRCQDFLFHVAHRMQQNL